MDQLVAVSQAAPGARSDHLAAHPHRIHECALRWAGIPGQRHPARALGVAHILAIARGDQFSYRLAEPRRQVRVIPIIRYQPWHLQPERHLLAATIDRYPRVHRLIPPSPAPAASGAPAPPCREPEPSGAPTERPQSPAARPDRVGHG